MGERVTFKSSTGPDLAGIIEIPEGAVRGWGVWSLVAYEITQPAVGVLVYWLAERWRPYRAYAFQHLLAATIPA